MAHRRNGYAKLDQVKELQGELVSMENPPQMTGRFLSMILVPNQAAVAAAKKKAAQEEAARQAEGSEQAEVAQQAEGSESGAGGVDA
jgi:hypothetical protein